MTNLSNDKQRSPTALFKIAAQILLLAALLMGMNNAKADHFELVSVNSPATFNSAAHFTISVTFNNIPSLNLNHAVQVTNGRQIGAVPTGLNPRTFTIAPNLNGRDVIVTFPAGLFSQGGHNYPDDIVRTVRYERPTATFSNVPANHSGVNPFMVTVTLSKPADDFDITDIDFSANASGMLSGSGTDYTLTVIPANTVSSITINIAADSFTDALDAQNTASALTVAHSGQPFVALSGAPSSATGLTPFEVTARFTADVYRFDEAVGFTLLPIDITSIPVTVTNGMGRVKSHSGRTFVLEITPAGTGDSIDIFLPRNAVIYSNFNGNAPSNVVRVPYTDTTPPVVTLGTITAINSLTFQVALNFSEAITRSSFTAADVMTNINNGMVRVTGDDSNGADIVLIITHDGTVPTIVVSIPGRTFTDQAGNLNAASSEARVAYADDIRPDVTLSDLPDSHDGMTPFTVTVTVSEPVTSFVLSDFSADPSASVTLTGSGTTYTATITPEPDNTDGIEILVFESSFADATGNLNRGAQPVHIPYVALDITPPTVMVTGPAAYQIGGATFTVRLTFSEAVSGVSAGTSPSEASEFRFQVDVDNGAPISATKISDSIYDVVIAYFGTTDDISITFLAGVATDASGNTNTVSNTLVVPFDPPLTVRVDTSAQTANNANAFNVAISFSEDVTDFVLTDIVFTNASALSVLTMHDASAYGVLVLADNTADVAITIPAGVAMAGTKTNMVSNTLMLPYDHAPTVVLAAAATSMTSPFTVTATFSEAVTGLEAAEIDITNATVMLAGAGTTYTLTITPTAAGDVEITIPAGVAEDLDGEATANTASNTLTVAYTLDVTPPTVAFIAPPANHDGTNPFTVMVRLSEPAANFVISDISVSSNANTTLSGSGTDYTLTVTPTDTNDITISVPPGGFTDTAGNANMMASETLTVAYTTGDSTRPMATLTGPAAYKTGGVAGGTGFIVRLTFSEDVSGVAAGAGFSAILELHSQFRFTNSSLGSATKISDSIYDVTIGYFGDTTDDISITFRAGVATDADGNTNTVSNTLVVPSDNIAPTVVFSDVPANHDGTTPFTVTVTLSEPADDFIADDIELSDNASGTLSGSGLDYRLTVTPTNTNSITIDIPADSFTDVATNGNTASETVTVTLADTTPPTATFSGVPASHDGMTPFTLTITLSEPSTDFVVGDIFTTTNVNIALSGSGTDYSLTVTPIGIGGIIISLNTGVFTDAANNGNPHAGTGVIPYAAPDITPPTVTLTGPDPATFSNTEPFVVTATFDEAVTGFDAFADSTVTNGTATALEAIDATTYTLTIMPYDTTGDIEITIPAGVAMDAASNGNTASDPLTMAYVALDTIPPAVELSTQSDTANASDTMIFVAVTFDEPVTGFDAIADIRITGGTAIAPHRVTSMAYTLTITPTPMTDGTITIQIPANVATDTEGNGNSASNVVRVTYDSTPPTVVLTGNGGTTSALSYTTVALTGTSSDINHASFTSDEWVTTPANVMVTSAPGRNGFRINTVYTITHDGTAEEITITAPIGSFTDNAGNPNTEAVILTFTYTPPDIIGPTVMLSGALTSANASDTTFDVTATFSEPVTGFNAIADITVTNGTAAAPVFVRNRIYTLTITPAGTDGTITIQIPANVATDTEGDGNIASNTVSVTYDATPPTVVLSGNGDTFNTLTFTSVSFTGTSPDIDHASFTSDEWVTTPENVVITSAPGMDGFRLGTVYTITHDGTADEIIITVPIGSFTDNAGNPNTEAFTFTFNYVDATPPTATFTDPPANHSNSEFMVTVTLSEPTDDFVISDITFSDNASGTLTGSGTDYTLTVTPTDTNSITITIAGGTFTDAASLPNLFTETLTVAYASDAIRPTVMLTGPTLGNIEPFAVTATFSKPVTGFDAVADITVTNGTATAPVAMDSSETTYTLTITPAGTGDIGVTIPAAAAMDGTGNTNTASETLPVTIDTIRPTATFSGSPASHDGMTPFTLTITLSEPSDDFVVGDVLTTTNVNIALSGSGTDYSLTVTPIGIGGIGIGGIIINVTANVFTDAANNGNPFAGTGVIPYIAPPDTTRPTVTFSDFPASHDGMTTFTVTVTLSEPSNDFNLTNIQVHNATETLSEGMNTDSGTVVYTLTVTPTSIDLEILIATNANLFTDLSGNGNHPSSVATIPYAAPVVDTIPPTATFSGVPASHDGMTPFTLTITLSEPSTDFVVGDVLTTTNANIALSGSGTDYSLTVTPIGIGSIIISLDAGVFTDAANNGNLLAATGVIPYAAPVDTTPLTVTLSGPSTYGAFGFTTVVRFSEDVPGLTIGAEGYASFTITNAMATSFTRRSGSIYDLIITPESGSTADISVTFNADAATAGTKTNTVSNTLTIAHSTLIQVGLRGPDSLTHDGETVFTVRVEFTSDVGGFDTADDITISGGTTSAPVVEGFGTFGGYILTITPDGTDDITISLNSSVAEGGPPPGNTPNAASNVLTVTYAAPADTTPPTVMLTGPVTTTELTFEITAVFSEQIIGFTADDVNISEHATVELSGAATMTGGAVHQRLSVTHDGSENAVLIGIPAGTLTDTSNNPNTASNTLTVANAIPADTTAPTVLLFGAPTTANSIATFEVTATFSEAVTGFDEAADITVTNASATIAGSGDTYTLTITPAGTDGEIRISIAADVAMDGADNGNEASTNTVSVTYDTTRPTVNVMPGNASNLDESVDAIARFSELVTGLEAAEIQITNGAVRFMGGGTTYSLLITPDGSGEDMVITIPEGVAMDAAGNLNTASEPATVLFLPPVVVLSGAPTSVSNTDTFTVTATFTKTVVFSDTSAITIVNGSVTNVAGSGTVYMLTIAPDGMGDIEITIPADVVMIGNIGNPASETLIVHYGAPITVALSDAPALAGGSSSFTVTATFSESVTGFDAIADITVTNGMAAVPVAMGNSETTYILTITPDGMGDIEITIPASVAEGDAGRTNRASTNPVSVTYDGTAPTVMLTGAPTAVNASTLTFAVTATFSEAVTGFDAIADITVTNGTAAVPAFVSEGVYTLTITPAGTDGLIAIAIPANVAVDAANNDNIASNTVSVLYDTTPPTIVLTGNGSTVNTLTFTSTSVSASPDIDHASFTSDEWVTTPANVMVVSSPSTSGFRVGTNYFITHDGTADEIIITVPIGSFTDNAGNPNTEAFTYTFNYGDTTTPPTVTLTGPATVDNDSPIILTMTFSEVVSGLRTGSRLTDPLIADQYSVTNGSVRLVTATGNEAEYSLGIDPAGPGPITVTVLAGIATDAANNGNTASDTFTVTYVLNTTAPTVVLTGPATFSTAEAFEVTATFDEGVTGFNEVADITVTGGTATAPFSQNTSTYTLTITPDGTNSDIEITIPAAAAADTATNGNPASETLTVTYAAPADTTRPTVTLSGHPTHNGKNFSVVVTFSEDVTGLATGFTGIASLQSYVTVINATAGLLERRAGSNSIYDLALVLASDTTPENTSDISVTFKAGFATAGTKTNTVSNTLTIAHSTLIQTTLQGPITHNGEAAFTVEVGFSEVLTGFDTADDITISGGTVSAPTPFGITGRIYMLTITPDGTADITISINSGIAMNSDSNTNAASNMLTVAYTAPADTTPPTVMLTGAPTAVNASYTTFAVTATFSEAVTGFDAIADITVTNGTAAAPAFVSEGIYTLTITPAGTDGAITITIPENVAADADSNGNTASSAVTVTYDNAPPTATFTGTDSVSNTDEFRGVILTFDEDIFGLGGDDFMVTNGEFVRWEGVTANRAYELIIKPDGGGDIIITLMAGAVRDLAVGNPNIATSHTVAYSSTLDPVSLVGPVSLTHDGETVFTVTVIFTSDVGGFDTADDITISGGTTSAPVPEGFGVFSNYILTITPDGTADITISLNSGVAETVLGNTPTAASNVLTVAYAAPAGNTPPTVTLAGPTTANASDTTFAVTATFSKAVTGFDAMADITVTGGTAIAPVAVGNSETTYTLTITPGNADGEITISIPEDVAVDAESNGNTASNTVSVTYDGTRPTVAITVAAGATTLDSTSPALVVFSEPVTGLEAGEIQITNGAVRPAGGGAQYILNITPDGSGEDMVITIPEGVVMDAAGNLNTASEPATVLFVAPVVVLSGAPTSVSNTDTFTVTATFTKTVAFSNTAAITIVNGSVTNVASSGPVGTVYTLTIAPDGMGDIEITIPAGIVPSADTGTDNIASETLIVTYTPPDNTPPTARFSNFPANHDGMTPFTVTVRLSEIATDFVVGDITISDNASGTFFGSGTGYRLTITPTDNNPITFDIAAGTFTDAATNPNTASEPLTVTYAAPADTTPPTVTFSEVPANHDGTSEFTVTVTLSETATDFDLSDITFSSASGTLTGSGTDYTLTVTPTDTSSVTIDIAAGTFTDAATNPNTASETLTVTYTDTAPDTTPPTVMFVDPPASHNGSEFTLTVRLSEPSTDFIERVTALLSGSAIITGSGMDYLLTFPTPGTVDNTISIFSNSFTDAAGNPNTPSGAVTVIYVDDTPPTVALTAPATANGVAATFAVTAEFSEDVTGFDTVATDIEVTNGTATIAGSGTTYTLTITPTVTDGEITINIPANAAMDGGNNGNTASTDADDNTAPVSVRYDGSAPTVMFVDPPASHNGSEFTLTVRLSEPSTDFIERVTALLSGSAIITGSGMDYLLTFPTPGTVGNMISIFSNSFTDAAGNPNTPSGAVTVIYVDDTPPTVALTAPATANGVAATFAVTAEFSEDVTGFDTVATDIEVTNGTATIAGSGTTYTLTITPTVTDGEITINIPANAAMDGGNNGNTASTDADDNTAPVSVRYDGSAPTVMFVDPPASHNGSEFTLTVRLSEPSTDFIERVTALLSGSAVITGSGMDYLLTFPTPGTVDNTISIFSNSFTDAAGNPNTPSGAVTVTYEAPDTTPPTVVLSSAITTLSSSSLFTVTATFSEDVTGFDSAADITVINGIAGDANQMPAPPVSVDGSARVYTLFIVPNTNGDVSISIPANAAMDGAGNGNPASAVFTVPFTGMDVRGPSVVLTPDSSIGERSPGVYFRNSNAVFEVTATFNEPVEGFGLDDILVLDVTTSNFMGMDGDTVYTFDVTPSDTSTVQLQVSTDTGIMDLHDNALSGGTSLSVGYDVAPPTVALSDYPATANASTTTFAVTATFSEAVPGFNAADITVTNGAVTVSGSGPIYTLTITPDGNDGTITIAIAAGVVTDVAGNANTASTNADSTTPSDPVSVTYDTTPPTVTLSSAITTLSSSSLFTVTATFSEDVTGFDAAADITVINGIAGDANQMPAPPVSVDGSARVYTLFIVPNTNGDVSISIPANAAMDGAGNGNPASAVFTVPFTGMDVRGPSVVLTPDSSIGERSPGVYFRNSNAVFEVTATFNEPVEGFGLDDILVLDVTTSNFMGMDGDTVYTFDVTPSDSSTVQLQVSTDTGIMDLHDNALSGGTSLSVGYDVAPPTVALSDYPATANASTTTFAVTATFSEAVPGFNAADITVTNGAVTVSGSGPIYTLTITPDGNDGTITIAIAAGVVTDVAGNANTASTNTDSTTPSDPVSVTYDATAPTVTLASTTTTANNRDPFAVTATFSEAVTGFDAAADITVTNATVTFAGTGTIYTLTITPDGTDGEITIAIAAGVAADAASNGNMASNLVSVTYDTTPPTVALSDYPATANGSTATFAVTATFSEAVPGFNAADITVTNGAVTVSGSGPIYTLTITPDGNDGTITIAIAAGVVTDVAGNANTASTNADSTPSDPVSVTYDGTAPTVTLASTTTTANNRDPFAVTATFSEAVTGFDAAADITVTNATVTFAGTGTIYTLTITPTTDGTITITIPAGVAADAVNNPNTASNTVSVTYDGTAPTVTLSEYPTTLNNRDSFTVTATFDEAVTGFDAMADIMVTGGTAMAPVATNAMTYTLTITPAAGTGDIEISIPADAAMDATGNGNPMSDTVTVAYTDTTPLTVTVDTSAQTANDATAFNVAILFSEDVTDFVLTDIVFNNASALSVLTMRDANDYEVLVLADNTGDVAITVPEGVAMAGTKTNMVSNTLMLPYDHAPTVVLAAAATAMTSPFTVTATFSEAVTGLEAAEIDITNATVMLAGAGTTYTLTITPTAVGDVEITIPAGAADDLDGEATANTASNTLTVAYTLTDTTAPTVAFSEVPANHDGTSAFTVTVTLSETADDFVVGDIDFSDNASGTLTGSGTDYTLTVTPTDTNSITIDIAADSFTNAADIGNTASETLTVAYTAPADTTPPTVTFSGVPTNHDGTSAFTVTVTLSEPATDFVVGDIDFSANTSGTLTGSGTDYTLTVTPTDTNSITIDIAAGSFTDASNNMNTAPETLTVTYDAAADTTRPTVMGLVPQFNIVDGNDPFEVTVTFSEAVTGFDAVADIMITSATTLAPVAMDGSETTYILTITPGGPRGEIVISIPANVAMDAAGNLNTASTTLRLTYDPPVTVALSLANPQFISDGSAPFAVTATFSEAVTTFAVAGVMVANGTATAVNGSGAVYTVTITPDGGNNDAITIQLIAEAGEVDTGGGRLPTESLASEVLQVMVLLDIIPPTVVLTDPAAVSDSVTTFAVTATFNEPVTGFDAVTDITVTNGTAAAPVSISATVYTLTITPDGMGDIGIIIPAEAAMDEAGNLNTASDTVTVTYDNTEPTVTLTGPDPATFSNTDAFVVTATFSEAVTGFDAVTDITVTNGTAAAPVAVGSSARIYTLTITPDDSNLNIEITIPAAAAMDTATNPNTASNTVTVTYTSDTTAPMVTLTDVVLTGPDPATYSSTEAFVVMATFSEAVTGFDAVADITVTNGTAAVPVAVGSSETTYTLTITPAGTGTITIAILAGAVMDDAGNTNPMSNTLTVAYAAPDTTEPTVTLTGPDPATFSNTEAFVVTATFSEAVTGFDAVTDITVTNGTATVPVAVNNSETTYTLTITPDGTNGDIEIFIPAGAAMDGAGNPNTESETLTVAYTASADTKAAITGFMLDRANKLASNQPGLARFLQGTDCGTFSANSTDASGSVDGCLSNGHTWGEISRTWSSDNAYTLATVGLHGLMRDDLIIGGLVQFDKADDDKRNITGQGWLVGPYFVRKPTDQNMTFEGRLLYGQTDNDISIPGSDTPSFDTERYLAQLRVTGEYGYRIATMMPSLDLTYTEDTQKAYTNTRGNLIGEQGIDLTQLTFGMDFKLPMAVQTGQLDLTGGLSGTYSETNGGESDVEGGRGRTELGLNYSRANGSGNGTTLRLGTFYDGISSDHESFGVNFSLDMKF